MYECAVGRAHVHERSVSGCNLRCRPGVISMLAISRWRRARKVRLLAGRDRETAQHAPEISTDTVALVAGLRTLPPRQRTVLVLYYLADLPVQQIAAELGCSPGSVKGWLSRGRTALAAAVRADDASPTSEASHRPALRTSAHGSEPPGSSRHLRSAAIRRPRYCKPRMLVPGQRRHQPSPSPARARAARTGRWTRPRPATRS